jgi:hypothetical protein
VHIGRAISLTVIYFLHYKYFFTFYSDRIISFPYFPVLGLANGHLIYFCSKCLTVHYFILLDPGNLTAVNSSYECDKKLAAMELSKDYTMGTMRSISASEKPAKVFCSCRRFY